MDNSIYRFRSIDKVLSSNDLGIPDKGLDELRNQQIYFSSLHELNDPMEGYKEIYWEGDEVVWKNLLKHYLMCLESAYTTLFIGGDWRKLSNKDLPIFGKTDQFPSSDISSSICDLFFSNEVISKLPKLLSKRKSPVRRNEILYYLSTLNHLAINCIKTIFDKKVCSSEELLLNKNIGQFLFTEDYFSNLEHIEQKYKNNLNGIDTISSIALNINAQLMLITQYNNRDKIGHNQKFLINFPEHYLKRIEDLLYPDFKIACFSSSYKNASMWSHYAGNHEGICFQFKKDCYEFHEIEYNKNFPEINFFQSLGNLSVSRMMDTWFRGEDQLRSRHISILEKEKEEKWRHDYWNRGYKILRTKTTDWKHENELRVIRYSTIGENISLDNYDFKNLEGIIFGINTKIEHKIKIIEIIEEKCKKTSRKDFKFYQAAYCKMDGVVKKQELSLLTFK